MKLTSFLPITAWLRDYDSRKLKGDLIAGLTVGVMLIPQGMAYAMIAGLPPIYGLYASTLPLVVYALFGTSRQLAVGPAAMVSLLTAAGIGSLAEGGTELYLSLAVSLAFFVGLIQVLLGLFRLGFLVNFLSQPVISGFTSAAALIIGLSQLKHLLGIDTGRSSYIHEILAQTAQQLHTINWPTLGIGLSGILLIIVIKRVNKAIPSPLLAVIFGVLVVWGLGLGEQGVKIVGAVPEGLPALALPSWQWSDITALLPIALAISLVSFMESYAVAKATQAKHKDYQVQPNQELLAIGLANVGSSIVQAFPITGGLSRTAVNDQAGAKTGMAGIITAVLIVLTLLFLTPLFYYLPKAILASIIMVAVFGLIDTKEPVHLWKTDRSDFWMLIITFLGTLTLGITLGIGVGVVLSLAMIIFKTTNPHMARLGQVPGTTYYRNINRFEQIVERADLLIVRFDAQLYFANLSYFQSQLTKWMEEKGAALQTIIISAESITNLDSSALHLLDDMVTNLKAAGKQIYFCDVKGPIRDRMATTGLVDKVGVNNFFMTIQKAVDYHDNQAPGTPTDFQEYTLQTNTKSTRA